MLGAVTVSDRNAAALSVSAMRFELMPLIDAPKIARADTSSSGKTIAADRRGGSIR